MSDVWRQAIVDGILESVGGVIAVYLYGSRARGEARPGSDMDLALLLARGCELGGLELLDLQSGIELTAGCPVEVSMLDLDCLVHAKEVITGGRVLYSSDEDEQLAFEMQALSSYARLCEDRAPVADAYDMEAHHG